VTAPFDFLSTEFGAIKAEASKAAATALPDPRTSCFYARRALEVAVNWAFDNDRSLHRPYDNNLSALVNSPEFQRLAGQQVYGLAREIIKLGNAAVHDNRLVRQIDSVTAVSKLFHFTYWLARTYGRAAKPDAGLTFDLNVLPRNAGLPPQTLEQLKALEKVLAAKDAELAAERERSAGLGAEVERLRHELQEAKQLAAAVPDTHDYSETETRDQLIDLMLREAGWHLTDSRDREFEVRGMPAGIGVGYVDYVLWGDDAMPLAVVEAKRTKRDAREGQQQAKLYADCLQAMFGQRPVIYCTNGYDIQMWDDLRYPPRAVQGFWTKDELQRLVHRRASRTPLSDATIDIKIADRYYQTRSIRRVGESFERDNMRKALVVMATGAGKTRTTVAMVDQLMRTNWVKRVLFLADRRALVRQATNAFKKHLPDSSPVNLLEDRDADGRVYLCTYPTMMSLINERNADGERRFGVGAFDLIVIDEAHRSVYQKYRAIFDYFDSLLVGLTATPTEDIDRNTYSLFELETGVPTDAYPLDEAVNDGFLVPAQSFAIPLKFPSEGIRYDDLSDADKERWDETDWNDSGLVDADEVGASAVNRWLFNTDTADKVLEHLMTHGHKVAGGDRLAKTIVFAANQRHANFIVDRFNANYPVYKGEFARVITSDVEQSESLIEKFEVPEEAPHIAVSVDMLDTGIDVPSVANLVFFKQVHSKTKFWQMIGRGTRLCPDLFGPGEDKRNFYVFDFCYNLEFFKQNPDGVEAKVTPPLGTRLFRSRLELVDELDRSGAAPELRASLASLLHAEVASMHVDNFVVRPKRRLVERFAVASAWETLSAEDHMALNNDVAGLPNQLPLEVETAKRFDLVSLSLQLALIRDDANAFEVLRNRVIAIAELLEDAKGVPAVAREMELIEAVQSAQWWEGVTLTMLERARVTLRGLLQFIRTERRSVVYTDFEDEIGAATEVRLDAFSGTGTGDFERYKRKMKVYLHDHRDQISLRKVYNNYPLTDTDLDDLHRVMREAGVGSEDDERRAAAEAGGFGLFVRSLVGLDKNAAKEAFGEFLADKRLNATQIDFIDTVIDHLAANGIVPPERFYEPPFTDLAPRGPDDLFTQTEIAEMITVLDRIRRNAGAA
jgi:type I restriction enzyme, R subunit